jgi:hypothetical protein
VKRRPMKRKGRKPESVAAKRARREFTETVLAKGACQIVIPHRCDGPMDACHIVDKQYLKAHAQFNLRLNDAEALACVWDHRNGIPGCRRGHGMFDSPFYVVNLEDLPDEAHQFALDYDCWWKLETLYPPRGMAA